MQEHLHFCINDAFTITFLNMETKATKRSFLEKRFFKFRAFVNKLWDEYFTLLNDNHITTTPAYSQCNSQVEV